MANFVQILDKLQKDCEDTFKKGTGDAISKLMTIFDELGIFLREHIQDITQSKIKSAISRLKQGASLSGEEKDYVRLWMVGDADYYAKMENNYQDWVNEIDRLMSDIAKLKCENPDVEVASKLCSLFRDASRTLADIFYYVQQKERLEKFAKAMEELAPEDRIFLARLLEQKLKSPDF